MEALRETIAEKMRVAFREVHDWAATRARIAADHQALAEAIAAGDAERAARTVTEHIRGFYELLHAPGE